jgi:acetaldehyde dehydrogenase (acetylating)
VNTPTTHGSIGLTTGLDPALTLGCGGWGGNITSDNISPRHLLNIKRLAYEIRPAVQAPARPSDARQDGAGLGGARLLPLPSTERPPVQRGVPAQALADRIDQFLGNRGIVRGTDRPSAAGKPSAPGDAPLSPPPVQAEEPVPFVCEDDVRQAIRGGRKILVGDKTLVTPSARDLGESLQVFLQAGWPR